MMSEPGPAADRVEEKREDGLTMFIRTRNQRAFLSLALRAALDALARLEDAGFAAEVLVIDDASQDGSQKLLRSVQALYDEPRLRTVCLEESAGPEALRDLGLRASAFRYVCLMNAGDELEPANLPLFLRSIVDTGAGMVYGNLVDKKGLEVAGFRSNVPIVPALPKIHHVDVSFCIVDARKAPSRKDPEGKGPEGWNVAVGLLAAGERVLFVPALLGYHHDRSAPAGGALRPPGDWRGTRRASSRTGERYPEGMPSGRTYHPDVGFLDE